MTTVHLSDLQRAYSAGKRVEVARVLLGGAPEPVAPEPLPPFPVVVPGERTQPSATQRVLPVLNRPADWPYRLRPEDVDRLVYEAARETLQPRDRELIRYACGLSSEASPSDPRFPVVLGVVNRIRRDLMREIGSLQGVRPHAKRNRQKGGPHYGPHASEVVTRDALGNLRGEDGRALTEDEAREVLAVE